MALRGVDLFKLFLVFAGTLLLGLTFFTALLVFFAPGGPVQPEPAKFDQTLTIVRGRIEIDYEFNKVYDCPADLTFFMETDAYRGGALRHIIVPIYSLNTTLTTLGEQSYILSLPLPSGLWDGDWTYNFRAEDQCPAFGGLPSIMAHSKPRTGKPRPIHISMGVQDVGSLPPGAMVR